MTNTTTGSAPNIAWQHVGGELEEVISTSCLHPHPWTSNIRHRSL